MRLTPAVVKDRLAAIFLQVSEAWAYFKDSLVDEPSEYDEVEIAEEAWRVGAKVRVEPKQPPLSHEKMNRHWPFPMPDQEEVTKEHQSQEQDNSLHKRVYDLLRSGEHKDFREGVSVACAKMTALKNLVVRSGSAWLEFSLNLPTQDDVIERWGEVMEQILWKRIAYLESSIDGRWVTQENRVFERANKRVLQAFGVDLSKPEVESPLEDGLEWNSGVDPYKSTKEIYECACECLSELSGALEIEAKEEGAKPVPDAARIAKLMTEASRFEQAEGSLRGTSVAEITRIYEVYGAIERAWDYKKSSEARRLPWPVPSVEEMVLARLAVTNPVYDEDEADESEDMESHSIKPAFTKPLTPSAELAVVVGANPLPCTEVTKKVWDYIQANKLQDSVHRRNINADAKLRPIFGKAQVSMFEMTKLISRHLS